MKKAFEKKVSVIVPVYNRAHKIKECIKSIQGQKYSNLEIICINDGSTDKSLEVLQSMAVEDERIVVCDKENGGPSSARNMGLEIASGEYIQFVDSDDYIDSNMVSCMVKSLESTSADLAVCGYRFSNNTPERIPPAGVWTKEKFVEKIHDFYTNGFICSPVNKLYVKNKIIDFFRENMDLGEDAVFNIKYLENVERICTVDFAPYYYYVGDTNSLSWRYNENAFVCEEIKNNLILDFLKREGKDAQISLFKEEFKKDFIRCFNTEIIRGDRSIKELTDRIYKFLLLPLWSDVFDINVDKINEKSEKIHKEIRNYIISKVHLRYRRKIKMFIKMIIKKA